MCSMHLLECIIKCITCKDNCTVSFLVLLSVSLVCMFLSLFVLSSFVSIDVVRSALNKVLSHIQKEQNKDRNTSAQGHMHKEN